MTGVSIFYDGKDAFYPQPTPFVSVDENNVYYGELWAKEEVLTLQGQLTGCTYDHIVAAQFALRDAFHKSYQTLEIHQQDSGYSGVVFQKELSQIESITFPASRWIGVMPYSIRIKCYPSGYYSGAIGILDPKETWAYQEQENHVAQVVHTISCRGVNTSSLANNALNNAINWASTKRGTDDIVTPEFIEYVTPQNFCLQTSQETVDRFNGTYSIADTYTNDLARAGYGVIRYNATLDSGVNAITVSLQGTVKGCDRNINAVRDAFTGFSPSGAALFLYSGIFQRTDLNPIPLSQSIDEDPYNAQLAFSYVYDNQSVPETYFDYSVSVASGSAIGVTINGEVITRGGDVKSKIAKNKAFAGGLNLYQIAVPFYNSFYPNSAQFPLNPRPLTSGIAVSESLGTVAVNAEFGNATVYSTLLDHFDFTLDFQPSVERFDFQPCLDGQGLYSLVDLGYVNRAALSIKGTAVINIGATIPAGLDAVQNVCEGLFGQYGRTTNVTLDRNILNTDRTDKRAVSFDFSWSFDSPNQVSVAPFVAIDNFGV